MQRKEITTIAARTVPAARLEAVLRFNI